MEKLVKDYVSEAFRKAQDIAFGSKDSDYNSSGIELLDYMPFGYRSGLQSMNQKLNRLISILESEDGPQNEAIEDTFIDLINYTAYTYAVFQIFGKERNFATLKTMRDRLHIEELDISRELEAINRRNDV